MPCDSEYNLGYPNDAGATRTTQNSSENPVVLGRLCNERDQTRVGSLQSKHIDFCTISQSPGDQITQIIQIM